MDNLKQIKQYPTSIDGVEESSLRSYHILDHILRMIEREDSKESIFEMVEFLKGEENAVISSDEEDFEEKEARVLGYKKIRTNCYEDKNGCLFYYTSKGFKKINKYTI